MKLFKNRQGLCATSLGFLAMVQGSNIYLSEIVNRRTDGIGTLRRESLQGDSGRRLHKSQKAGTPSPGGATLSPDLWNIFTDANGNVITTCKVLPEGNSTTKIVAKVLSFDYNLYLSEAGNADVEGEIATVEARAHEALTPKLLPCNFVEGDTIVAALSSDGADELVGECQNATTSPCWLITAQMTMVVSSTLSDPEWIALLYPYIEESLATAVDGQNITNIEFRGFVGSGLIDSPTLPVTNPTGNSLTASQGNMALTAPPSQGLGPVVIAIAAIALVLLSAFLIQRYRRRQTLFLAQSHRDTCYDNPPPTVARKHKVAFLNDNELLGQGDADGLEVIDEESRHRTPT